MPPEPTFVGLGAPKAATTWLFHCLREHPSVFIPDEKEIGFFTWDYVDARQTEYREYFRGAGNASARGEIYVMYLSNPVVAERIKLHLPDARLFVSLRNPVEQVYSYYWHLKRQNFHHWGGGEFIQPASFAAALDEIPHELVEPSYYAQHLKRWFALFPREQIHVLLYEDIKAAPLMQVQALYRFLGVDDTFVPPSLERRDAAVRAGVSPKSETHDRLHAKVYGGLNRFVYHKIKQAIGVSAATRMKDALRIRQIMQAIFYQEGYPSMQAEDRRKLLAMLNDDIRELEVMLQRDLTHWLR